MHIKSDIFRFPYSDESLWTESPVREAEKLWTIQIQNHLPANVQKDHINWLQKRYDL